MKKKPYFTKFERMLWIGSAVIIFISYFLTDRSNIITPAAALLGVTSILLNAKGNPIGQALMVVFSCVYGWLSWKMRYYGEMITYLGMTMPMAVLALIAWLRHPFNGNAAQVAARRISRKEWPAALALTAAVTAGFYFILAALHTPFLPLSTLSIATSFLAVYLTFRRDPHFSLIYAANDLVLILLWLLSLPQNRNNLAVVICFAAFFANDVYGFASWKSMEKAQRLFCQTKTIHD